LSFSPLIITAQTSSLKLKQSKAESIVLNVIAFKKRFSSQPELGNRESKLQKNSFTSSFLGIEVQTE
jgi:hypothetical protein